MKPRLAAASSPASNAIRAIFKGCLLSIESLLLSLSRRPGEWTRRSAQACVEGRLEHAPGHCPEHRPHEQAGNSPGLRGWDAESEEGGGDQHHRERDKDSCPQASQVRSGPERVLRRGAGARVTAVRLVVCSIGRWAVVARTPVLVLRADLSSIGQQFVQLSAIRALCLAFERNRFQARAAGKS